MRQKLQTSVILSALVFALAFNSAFAFSVDTVTAPITGMFHGGTDWVVN